MYVPHLDPMCNLSSLMRKPAISICENKDTDQLCGNAAADQRPLFSLRISTIPLHPNPKSEISSLGLCWIWVETLKTGIVVTQLICCVLVQVGNRVSQVKISQNLKLLQAVQIVNVQFAVKIKRTNKKILSVYIRIMPTKQSPQPKLNLINLHSCPKKSIAIRKDIYAKSHKLSDT